MSSTMDLMREHLAGIEPIDFEITDDSAKHAGHAGAQSGGGHYRLRIVSLQFEGKPMMARHRMVYHALGSLMQQDIHALSITANTPNEL